MNNKKITGRYVFVYTVLFSILCVFVFLPFILSGKSLIGNGDGQSQYILQLEYMGRYLREWASGILRGDFIPRRYDFTIGMGDDISCIVRFHPLDFLSVFVPSAGTELLYHVLIFLRMYLAGLAFAVLVFAWKRGFGSGSKDTQSVYCAGAEQISDSSIGLKHSISTAEWGVLAGTMVYLFNGYTFSLGIVHPIYLSPLITLPLLLYGAERIMNDAGKYRFVLFSIVTALGFISNYYFMYIESIALLFYVLVRFFQLSKGGSGPAKIKAFFSLFVRMSIAYLAGLMLSAVTLFPVISRYLSSYRSERISDVNNLLVYEDKRRYIAWFINLISPLRASGNGTHLNYAVIVLPAILLLFAARRRRGTEQAGNVLRISVIAVLLCLLIPAGGYVMAVFNNENNRWVFLIALVLGAAVSFEWEDFLHLTRKTKRSMIILTGVFGLLIAVESVIVGIDLYNIAALAELMLFTAALCFFSGRGTVFLNRLLVLSVILSTIVNGFMTFGKGFGNLVRYYMDYGTSLQTYRDSPYAAYNKVGDDSFYRTDGEFTANTEDNAALYLGYPGVQMYNSVLNRDEIQALLDTANPGLTTMLHVHCLDGHTPMSALAAVRYYLTDQKNTSSVPAGYAKESIYTEGKYSIYENEHPLGISFGQEYVLPLSELADMNPVEREYAMLYAAVMEDDKIPDTAKTLHARDVLEQMDVRSVTVDLPDGQEGIERTESGYHVKKRKAGLNLEVPVTAGEECYLLFSGLNVGNAGKMKVTCDGIKKNVTLLDSQATYTMGRSDYAVRLGCSREDGIKNVKIRFTTLGRVDLDSIRFVYAREQSVTDRLDQLAGENVTAEFGEDTVSISVTGQADGVQVFSIPYSKGWTAQIDGADAELYCTDECFLGVLLQKGKHEIVLTYCSPALTMGVWTAFAGLILIVVLLIIRRFAGRRKGEQIWNNIS